MEEIAEAFQQARESMRANNKLVSAIRELKAQSNGTLKTYAMSNISLPDYDFLRETKSVDWSIFDMVFPSAVAGERKPNLAFYQHVIAESGLDPSRTVFVDDKVENVLSARSLGLHGIVFDDVKNVIRQLRNLCGDPSTRGWDYLRQNAGKLLSVTDSGVVIDENFAQLLLLEATNDPYVKSPSFRHVLMFEFIQIALEFPDDLDTTALGLTITQKPTEAIHSVMDEMLQYVNADGIVQTYFDNTRPRFDACVCVNVLNLFYQHGRGDQLAQTLDWVHQVLLHRAYLDGTRYYTTAECFLFFLARFLSGCQDKAVHDKLKPLFVERVKERIGAEGDALALVDMQTLLSKQCEDGSWEISWVYKLVAAKTSIASIGLTTAIALQAISSAEKLKTQPKGVEIP
ncbi:hypothetical protein K435DRAFT_877769 [Dendrothele bispora CBS 962.96]|uniref:HAD-like protein n=1 Tax=Dendrothele bispora (strain CBS 962.96) TaxID=1314807 RepID=A0A4S8KPB2_DENBC|nr:hypothetical protein K435DRAFT_877769 [Dendrothele bispora CBS 962.96]